VVQCGRLFGGWAFIVGGTRKLAPVAPFCGVLLLFSGRHFASGKLSRFARLLLGVKREEREREGNGVQAFCFLARLLDTFA
jgi:hypothetical protein